MKVLLTNFHRGNGGGHDTYVMSLLGELARNHDITLAVPHTSRLFRLAGSLALVRLQALDFSPRGLAWLKELWVLWRLLSFGRFDIIHVNGSSDHKLVMLTRLVAVRRPCIVFTKHNDHQSRSVGNSLRAWLGTPCYRRKRLRGDQAERLAVL
ncbi:glycosyltransferase family 4 protein [Cupriavidus basilensis]|uniref:glycosyltransferase family 4 protein n=1 Tax=Cupriavidus basilensis TaxID=68895 RepID=UPI002E806D6D|nr:glycosyltransferase family 4 protein [Cupriavidus basilensis]